MFPTSTLPALLSLLSTMCSRLGSSHQFPQGCFHAAMFDVSHCILRWLELLMRFSSFAYSSAWYTLLLFSDKLPFSLPNSFCLHLPWEDFCQYWLPSLQSHNLSSLFISLFPSFPLSYDVSRADTHCCNSRVQHGTYHWMGLIIFKKGGKDAYLAGEIPWSQRWFSEGKAYQLHSGCADPCNIPKCRKLDCIICGSGGRTGGKPQVSDLRYRPYLIHQCLS